jgi:hypothetical protein
MEWFKKFFGRGDYLSDQEKFAVLHRPRMFLAA